MLLQSVLEYGIQVSIWNRLSRSRRKNRNEMFLKRTTTHAGFAGSGRSAINVEPPEVHDRLSYPQLSYSLHFNYGQPLQA